MADNTCHTSRNFPSRFQKAVPQANVGFAGNGTPESPRSVVGCESPSSTNVDVLNQPNISPTSISPTSNSSMHPPGQSQRPYFHRSRASYGGGNHPNQSYNGGQNHHGMLHNSSQPISPSFPYSKPLQDFMLNQWNIFENNYLGRRQRNSINNGPLSSRSQGRTNSPHHQVRSLHQVGHIIGGSRRFSDNSHHHHLNHSDALGGDFSGNNDDYTSNRRFRGPFQHNSHAPLFPSGDNSWQRGQLLSRNNSPDVTSHQNALQRTYGQSAGSVPQSSTMTSGTVVTTTATAYLNINNANSHSHGKNANTIVHHGFAKSNSSTKPSVSELSLEPNSLISSQLSSNMATGLCLSSDGDSAVADGSITSGLVVSHSVGLSGCTVHVNAPKSHAVSPGDLLSTTDHYYTPDPSSSQTSSPPTILSPSDNTSTNFFQTDSGTVLMSASGVNYPSEELAFSSSPDEIRPVFDHKSIFAASTR